MTTGSSSLGTGAEGGPGVGGAVPAFIGVMQGRLVPPVGGRIQAFPGEAWPLEFERAAALGLSSVEWIFEEPIEQNPFWTATGRRELGRVMERTGVRVHFVCADIFMESPWVRMAPGVCDRNRVILQRLIEGASELGVTGIEIPCVDPSEIRTLGEEEELLRGLEPAWGIAERMGVLLGLETSLSADRFRGLLERIGRSAARANYDTGNSASLGFDPAEEIAAYGRWIANVHIKDRVRGGSTVPLGQGAADIPAVLRLLAGVGYRGGYILQAARRGDEMEAVGGYARQLRGWLSGMERGASGS